jgi:hypothetical protein
MFSDTAMCKSAKQMSVMKLGNLFGNVFDGIGFGEEIDEFGGGSILEGEGSGSLVVTKSIMSGVVFRISSVVGTV